MLSVKFSPVEAAAVAERVREVDEDADNVEILRKLAAEFRILGMNAARMATPLVVQDRPDPLLGVGEIASAVDGQHEAQLLAREWG